MISEDEIHSWAFSCWNSRTTTPKYNFANSTTKREVTFEGCTAFLCRELAIRHFGWLKLVQVTPRLLGPFLRTGTAISAAGTNFSIGIYFSSNVREEKDPPAIVGTTRALRYQIILAPAALTMDSYIGRFHYLMERLQLWLGIIRAEARPYADMLRWYQAIFRREAARQASIPGDIHHSVDDAVAYLRTQLPDILGPPLPQGETNLGNLLAQNQTAVTIAVERRLVNLRLQRYRTAIETRIGRPAQVTTWATYIEPEKKPRPNGSNDPIAMAVCSTWSFQGPRALQTVSTSINAGQWIAIARETEATGGLIWKGGQGSIAALTSLPKWPPERHLEETVAWDAEEQDPMQVAQPNPDSEDDDDAVHTGYHLLKEFVISHNKTGVSWDNLQHILAPLLERPSSQQWVLVQIAQEDSIRKNLNTILQLASLVSMERMVIDEWCSFYANLIHQLFAGTRTMDNSPPDANNTFDLFLRKTDIQSLLFTKLHTQWRTEKALLHQIHDEEDSRLQSPGQNQIFFVGITTRILKQNRQGGGAEDTFSLGLPQTITVLIPLQQMACLLHRQANGGPFSEWCIKGPETTDAPTRNPVYKNRDNGSADSDQSP